MRVLKVALTSVVVFGCKAVTPAPEAPAPEAVMCVVVEAPEDSASVKIKCGVANTATDDKYAGRCAHPEAEGGEIWISNVTGYPSWSSWKTKRLGKIAYDNKGRELKNHRPMFVQIREILASGVEPICD